MKLPRNTRIFRGQLDVAPVACVFFMTALLLFLHSQIVFVPGVRLDLHPNTSTNRPSLFIDSQDIFHYAGSSMSRQSFLKKIRSDAEKSQAPNTILLQTDHGASTNALNDVRALAAEVIGYRQSTADAPKLVDLLDDPSEVVRSAAHDALVRLNGGTDLGADRAKWKERFP